MQSGLKAWQKVTVHGTYHSTKKPLLLYKCLNSVLINYTNSIQNIFPPITVFSNHDPLILKAVLYNKLLLQHDIV